MKSWQKIGSAQLTVGLVAASIVVLGAATPTYASVATVCNGQDAYVDSSVTVTSNKFTITHMAIRDVPAGVSYSTSTTWSMSNTATLSSSVSVDGTYSADWVIGSASVKVGMSLAASGSRTNSSSVTETWGIGASSANRRFVFFDGTNYAQGGWSIYDCSKQPGVGNYYAGTWHSFRAADERGVAQCPRSRYAAGSAQYVADLNAGC